MPFVTLDRRHGLPELPANFYPELVQRMVVYCGNEFQTQDFHSAVKTLDQELRLRLSSSEKEVLGLMLTALSHATRFGGDINISSALGENSAVHSCHTAILMNEVFRRANLHFGNSSEATSLRLDATLSALLHDKGELLGELSSLAQRVINENLSEQASLERRIYQTALGIAAEAAELGYPDRFYQALQKLREQTSLDASKHSSSSQNLISTLEQQQPKNLSAASEKLCSYFLKLFDLAEFCSDPKLSSNERFAGYLVKAVEHLQGVRHFNRFSHKEIFRPDLRLFHQSHSHSKETRDLARPVTPGKVQDELLIPVHLNPSIKLIRTLQYLEGEVGSLFSHASTDLEKRLAETARDMIYQSAIELLNSSAPAHIDRHAGALSEEMKSAQSALTDLQKTFAERKEAKELLLELLEAEARFNALAHAQEMSALDPKGNDNQSAQLLARVESRERLMGLYYLALQKGFKPQPGQALVSLDKLPAELSDFREFEFASLSQGHATCTTSKPCAELSELRTPNRANFDDLELGR